MVVHRVPGTRPLTARTAPVTEPVASPVRPAENPTAGQPGLSRPADLRTIGLESREWIQLVQATDSSSSPHTGQKLDHAFKQAQAVVALFTLRARHRQDQLPPLMGIAAD